MRVFIGAFCINQGGEMKLFIAVVAVLLLASYTFADTKSPNLSESETLKALRSVWKNQESLHAKEDKNDLTIVYGGADVSNKPSFNIQTTVV